jgi:DNA-3-methyladenine glycosylase II
MGSQMKAGIEAQLSKSDPKLGRLIKAVVVKEGPQRIAPSKATVFVALVRAIIYQSITGSAAATIFGRLQDAQSKELTPATLLAMKTPTLRSVGISQSKAKAITGLARWFVENKALAQKLPDLPDDEIRDILTGIPGIGAWTANVFLIFSLGRKDVMPVSDLGIRRGVQLAYGLTETASAKAVQEGPNAGNLTGA